VADFKELRRRGRAHPAEMIVLDANILNSRRPGATRSAAHRYLRGQGVRFFAPDVAFDDAEKYLPPLLKKRGKPHGRLFGIARILAKHHRGGYSGTLCRL